MAICPTCGFDNLYGALACAQCYNTMGMVKAGPDESTVPNPPDVPKPQPLAHRRFTDSRIYGPNVVIMYFENISDPLVLHIARQAVLGRQAKEEMDQPRIDLTPYGVHSNTVSRLHAVIRRTEEGLFVEDLGSSNGTYINGKALTPFLPAKLQTGDVLLLGQFSLEIFFH